LKGRCFQTTVTLSLIQRTVCAHAQFSGCSSTTNSHSESGQMAVCCRNLMLGALHSHSALSVMVGTLFKNFSHFLNTPCIVVHPYVATKLIFCFSFKVWFVELMPFSV
jgi:hypothetical protein